MKYLLLICIFIFTCSCHWFKQKSKDTINKSGEVVAKSGSEFVNGMKKGIEKTFENQVVISNELLKKGLKTGKIIINSSDSATDNIISAYLIFDDNINQNITIKIFTENGEEYGRVTQNINANKGEAKYIDFVFDKRTNIDGKGKITIE